MPRLPNPADLEALKAFVEEQMAQGAIRKDEDPFVVANVILALYWEMVTQLFAGFDKDRVYETWSKSMTLILGS